MTHMSEVIWNGRGPLTEWPERDWIVFLTDSTWQSIWDVPPRTSSMLLARWMTGRDGRDDGIQRTTSAPVLSNLDTQARMEAAWAKLGAFFTAEAPQPGPSQPSTARQKAYRVASVEDAIREVQIAEAGSTEPVSLCPHSNKIKHPSRLWALQHRLRLASRADESYPECLEVYKCGWCGSWHVGHRA